MTKQLWSGDVKIEKYISSYPFTSLPPNAPKKTFIQMFCKSKTFTTNEMEPYEIDFFLGQRQLNTGNFTWFNFLWLFWLSQQPYEVVISIFLFHRWLNWGTKSLSDLWEVPQLVRGRPGILNQAIGSKVHALNCLSLMPLWKDPGSTGSVYVSKYLLKHHSDPVINVHGLYFFLKYIHCSSEVLV